MSKISDKVWYIVTMSDKTFCLISMYVLIGYAAVAVAFATKDFSPKEILLWPIYCIYWLAKKCFDVTQPEKQFDFINKPPELGGWMRDAEKANLVSYDPHLYGLYKL